MKVPLKANEEGVSFTFDEDASINWHPPPLGHPSWLMYQTNSEVKEKLNGEEVVFQELDEIRESREVHLYLSVPRGDHRGDHIGRHMQEL